VAGRGVAKGGVRANRRKIAKRVKARQRGSA
jgi:hypothetical protein